MSSIAELLIQIRSIGAKTAAADLDRVNKASVRAEKSADHLSRSTDNLYVSYKNLRNSAMAYATYNSVKAIANTGLEFDRMNRSLVAATESTESARKEMTFLRSEADRIGVSILSVGKAYAQLSAAAKGTSITQGQVRDIFTSVSEASVVLGLSADDTKGAFRALVQVMSKGKVQAEELRGQIGERFPGAFQAAARAMGKSTEGLSKMLEQGNLLADEFIPKFSAEIKRTYKTSVPEALKSSQAAFGRFQTAMANAQNELAQGGVLDALAIAATAVSKATTTAISQLKEQAEWAAAMSVSQISLYEYSTEEIKKFSRALDDVPLVEGTVLGAVAHYIANIGGDADAITKKLDKLKRGMDEAGGPIRHAMPKNPHDEEKKPKKSRSDALAEKRALDRSKKSFARLKEDMQTEEETIAASYARRTEIIKANTEESSAIRSRLLERSKKIYEEDSSALAESKTAELTSLQEALSTEEESVRASYARRIEIVKNSSFESEKDRNELLAKIQADLDLQLAAVKENRDSSLTAVKDSLLTEEEEILNSYNRRRDIILSSAAATEEEKASLIEKLDSQFATDALGQFNKPDTYEEKLNAVKDYYTRRHDLVMSNTQITEDQRTALELELTTNRNEQLRQLESAHWQQIAGGAADTFSGLAELAKVYRGKQSKEYRAMFVASQTFEVAQAIMKTYDAATGAYSSLSSIPYVGPALGAAAAAAAVGAGMANVAQIKGQSYSGAHDAGGRIPSGSVGLVGEIGPELVSGPANVTSRKDTAAMLNKPAAPTPPPVNNIRIVNAFDTAVVGDYVGSDAGEKAILNVIKRNQNIVKSIVS